jgi:hypothetical protein
MQHYAIDYKRYAQITVPRYRALPKDQAFDHDSLIYSIGDQDIMDYVPTEPFSWFGHVQPGYLYPSVFDDYTDSNPDTPLDTPLDTPGSGFDVHGGYDCCSPSLISLPATKLSYNHSEIVEQASLGTAQTGLLPTMSGLTLVKSTDWPNLPLPPIGVLLAWHAHLMRPDLYEASLETDFKNLKGVPFPLREAVSPVLLGTGHDSIADIPGSSHKARYFDSRPTAMLAD